MLTSFLQKVGLIKTNKKPQQPQTQTTDNWSWHAKMVIDLYSPTESAVSQMSGQKEP